LINGGGSGSLHIVSQDHQLTGLAGGSGLYGPTLFDHYRSFTPTPVAFFVSPVVRKPSPRHAVVYAGGYIASGPPSWSRQPLPWMPRNLRLLRNEGAGEVQTPLRGAAAADLQVGDQVWFRHAKAGELCERFDRLHLVQGCLTCVAKRFGPRSYLVSISSPHGSSRRASSPMPRMRCSPRPDASGSKSLSTRSRSTR